MICSFCVETILESGKTWDFHHSSLESLRDSLDKKCPICVRLAADEDDQPAADTFPVYRWTIRQAANAREIQEVVILTFRPINNASAGTNHAFYLVSSDGMSTEDNNPEARTRS
jgi:hypothetical protein